MMFTTIRNAFMALSVLNFVAALPGAAGELPYAQREGEAHGGGGAVEERFLGFQTCTSPSMGLVQSVVVSANIDDGPALEVSGDSSIVFHAGRMYDITITYTSPIKAHLPRAALIARDDSATPDADAQIDGPSLGYAYSGQSFNACKYTSCPVRAHTLSTYTYQFRTLHSRFSWLTFNMTSTFLGPSLFCVGFPVTFFDAPEWESTSEKAPAAWDPVASFSENGGGGESGLDRTLVLQSSAF